MSNIDKLIRTFAQTLQIETTLITDELSYNAIPEWDSVGHMALIAALEEAFGIMLDTDDIIDMTSVAMVKTILSKYDVAF
jgi:acyl carrier protein